MGYSGISFPRDSVFLVTGGAGFIGSNLCEALLELGYAVRCLDDLSTGQRSNIEALDRYPAFSFLEGDIRCLDTCLMATEGAHFVLHQAAWGSVPRSIEMPVFYEEVNIRGTLNVLEAARRNNVAKVVYASSSSVYGDHPGVPKTEGTEGEVLSPYAVTKRANEEYGKLYARLYGLDTYGLRYFNVFGRRQNPEGAYAAVIPKFIRALLRGERPVINGDGRQSRDFTYIDNVVEANIRACKASSDVAGEVFNISSGGREYLIDVYVAIRDALGVDIEPQYGQERVGDIRHSCADIEKARKVFGYEPDYDFHRGLAAALEWYRNAL